MDDGIIDHVLFDIDREKREDKKEDTEFGKCK